ncbi:MAG: tetratricopeptide repeat protein [Candidatus Obscuribacterales bacterium]|nr:tetratricopeptide repeat protein [Candidatus Obscuribacterales bacterium]
MAKTIQGFISAKTGLVPAFKEIADLPEGQDGILRIETADLEGELALSKSRYITGAYVQTSGAKGVDALKVLLSARKGSFRYAHVEEGFAAELQQRIRLDIRKLVAESAEDDQGPPAKSEPTASTASSSNVKAVQEKNESPKAKERTPSTRIDLGGQRIYADNFDDDDEDDYDSLTSFSRSARAPIGESLFATEDPADADDDEWLKRLAKPKAKEKEEREAAEREAKARAEKEAAEKEAKAKAEKEAAEKEAKARAEKEAAEKEAKARAEKEAAEKEAKARAEKEAAEKEAKAKAEKEAAEKEAKAKAEKEAAEKEAKARAEKEAKAQAEKEAKAVEKEAAEREARALAAKAAAEKEKGEDDEKDQADKDAARVEAKSRVEKFKEAAEADTALDQRETAFLKNLNALPVKPVQSQLAARADQKRAESKVRPKTEADYDFGKVDISKLPASKSATNLEAAKLKADETLTKTDESKETTKVSPENEKAPEKKSQWSVPSHFENVHAAGTHTTALQDETVSKDGEEDFSDIDAEIERELATASGGAQDSTAEATTNDEATSTDENKSGATEQFTGDKTSETLTPISSISQNKMSALGQLRADAVKASEQKTAVPSQLKRPLPAADKNKPDISELDAIKTPNPLKKLAETAAAGTKGADATTNDEAAGDENESWVAKVVSSAKKEKVRESQMKMAAMAPIIPEAPRKEPITPSVRGKIQDDYSRSGNQKREPKQKTKFLASKNNRIGVAVVAVGAVVASLAVGRTLLADSYSQRAATMMAHKDYKHALAEINTALTIDGGLKVAHFNKGQIEAKLNDDNAALEEFNSILKDDPNHIGALEHRAEIYVKQGQYQQALADCTKLMLLEGSSPSLSLMSNRAAANLMLGNNLDALSNFSMALQQANKDPQLLIGRGLAYSNLKQFDKAMKDLDKAIKLNPKNPAAYVARAKTYLAQKNFDLAFADFNRALTLSPGDAAVLTQRGASLGDAGQFEQALNSFSQAIKINKNYAEAYKQRARILTLQHKYPEALADVAQLGKMSKLDADYYRQLGDIFSLQGADAKALESYTASISKSPNSASLESRAGLYAKKNDFKTALADISTALTLNSTDSNLYVQKAIYEDKLGDSMSANSDFTKAVTLYPLNLKAHIARGQFLLRQQESSSAEEAFDTALKIDPKSAEAKQGKATARTLFAHLHPRSSAPPLDLAPSDRIDPQDKKLIASGTFPELISAGYKQLSKGNNERATALLAKAVRLNPNDANARRYLAHALMANGDTDNAIAMLKAIVAINPDNTADSIALGEQLVKSGRVEDAIDTYSKTLTADKHNIKARCALARAYMSAGFKQKAKDVCEDGIKDSASPAETAALKATLTEVDGGSSSPASAPSDAPAQTPSQSTQ